MSKSLTAQIVVVPNATHEARILSFAFDPTAGTGSVAPLGSIGVRTDLAPGLYLKGAAGDTDWVPLGHLDATLVALAYSASGNDLSDASVALGKLASLQSGSLVGRDLAGAGPLMELPAARATALVDLFTTVLRGGVPAPGTSTTGYLRDDGTWVDFLPTPTGFFGDATDNSLHLDGTANLPYGFGNGGVGHDGIVRPDNVTAGTLSGLTVAKQYYVRRDIYCNDLTIDAGVILTTASRVFVRGTLTLNGYLGMSGVVGATGNPVFGGGLGSPPPGGTSADTLMGRGYGGPGASVGLSMAGLSAVSNQAPPGFVNNAAAAGTSGVGGNGLKGGGGGGGGGNGSIASQPGLVTVPGAIPPSAQSTTGSLANLFQAVTGRQTGGTLYTGGTGGGGGAAAASGDGGGGQGGSGGGCVVVCARSIVGTGALVARGGDGGRGYTGSMSVNQSCGGGGGGGGGWIVCIIGTGDFPACDVTGGVGGVGNHGTGGLSPTTGGSGGTGLVFRLRLGA